MESLNGSCFLWGGGGGVLGSILHSLDDPVVRVSDWTSEGPVFESQLGPGLLSIINSVLCSRVTLISLVMCTSNTCTRT